MAPTNQIFAPALSPQSAVVCGGPASPCSVVASGLPCTGSVVIAVSGLHTSTPTPPPPPMSLTTCMELVWHGEFNNLFSQYVPDVWTLIPTSQAPSSRWRVYRDSAKVRFCCQECGHGWTSMKGRVVFWYHLEPLTSSGYVFFKLYGQQCVRCHNGTFEHAMWYPEEVIKVVGNVYNNIGQMYYGFYMPPIRVDRRKGKPRNQHNADLCQACQDGLCREMKHVSG